MIDWLLVPFDPTRVHAVVPAIAWHGRLMVLAWGVLMPLGVIVARYGKILPGQDWPRRLDDTTWWHAHLGLQYIGSIAVLVATWLGVAGAGGAGGAHAILGWTVVAFTLIQVVGGWLRGSKGGPTAPLAGGSLMGDHYAMSARRRAFEYIHKGAGYLAIAAAMAALASGLWLANAPRWMWLGLSLWWIALTIVAVLMQRRGYAVDTYQAIWGPDPRHPGNSVKPIGIGVRRPRDRSRP